jgi:hypothetical protein
VKPGSVFRLVVGVVLIGLGSFVALRPLWRPHTSVTASRFLDVAFAAVFILRGLVNVRSALRASKT